MFKAPIGLLKWFRSLDLVDFWGDLGPQVSVIENGILWI